MHLLLVVVAVVDLITKDIRKRKHAIVPPLDLIAHLIAITAAIMLPVVILVQMIENRTMVRINIYRLLIIIMVLREFILPTKKVCNYSHDIYAFPIYIITLHVN